jgi:hypothetical protein
MASKNVETLRAAHESWNKRDFAGVIHNATAGLAYADHGRNITLNSKDKFREWTEGWAKAFSDGRITNPQYIDAGNIVVAQFTVEGTNDGPLGSLKPTGRKMSTLGLTVLRSYSGIRSSPGSFLASLVSKSKECTLLRANQRPRYFRQSAT